MRGISSLVVVFFPHHNRGEALQLSNDHYFESLYAVDAKSMINLGTDRR